MRTNRLKIAYIGGGSKFLVTLLHGLAEYAQGFRDQKVCIELALCDISLEACSHNIRYAEIVARETGISIRATATTDLTDAIRGSGWMIYAPGVHGAIEQFHRRFEISPKAYNGDVGPGAAIESLAVWPLVCQAARIAQRHSPDALFSLMVNPTDVLASAVHQRFGLKTVGMCVEVPSLVGFLSYCLKGERSAIRMEHIVSNHCGWVTQWTVEGQDGAGLLAEASPHLREQEDWDPHCDWFLDLFELSGRIRTSAYHAWPFHKSDDADYPLRHQKWMSRCIPDFPGKEAMRAAHLAQALEHGRMIPPFDSRQVHPEATPYWWPNMRYTLGAVAAGLSGVPIDPIPLQVRNGNSNPVFDEDAFLEVPTRIDQGMIRPQSVSIPASWMEQSMFIEPKQHLAAWLAGDDYASFLESILETARHFDLKATREVVRLVRKLGSAPGEPLLSN